MTTETSLNASVAPACAVGAPPQVALRPPRQVMRLDRMGSFFPTRLSFLRSLLRRLAVETSRVRRTETHWDKHGFGHAVYQVSLDGFTFSLIAYSSPLAEEERTDRVIAEAWDACFVLFDGVPDAADVERLHGHATRQEAGRYDPRVLVLSRANKSVRLFDHVVERLAAGQQPDGAMIAKIGYLMRTTAVYGNGKFGMADRSDFAARGTLSQPFRLEMLTVYLIREFTLDLVDHVARTRGGDKAVGLARRFRRQLGIGNSTGLGMAPFLVSHPVLINNWMLVRETALARVRALGPASAELKAEFRSLLKQVRVHLREWNVDDPGEQARIEKLRADWDDFQPEVKKSLEDAQPWDRMMMLAQSQSIDVQELLVALVLEPQGALVDGLCDCMEDVNGPQLDAVMQVGAFRRLLEQHYDWALDMNLGTPECRAMVWYVSQDKAEPRLGQRAADSEERREMPHHIAHKVHALASDLAGYSDTEPMAVVLLAHPDHRDLVRRVQTIARHPYGEIRDNLVAQNVRPIDLLRCKLSFFGASKFDPRSDRWTRITLYQGAPTADELNTDNAGDVFLPAFGS